MISDKDEIANLEKRIRDSYIERDETPLTVRDLIGLLAEMDLNLPVKIDYELGPYELIRCEIRVEDDAVVLGSF